MYMYSGFTVQLKWDFCSKKTFPSPSLDLGATCLVCYFSMKYGSTGAGGAALRLLEQAMAWAIFGLIFIVMHQLGIPAMLKLWTTPTACSAQAQLL